MIKVSVIMPVYNGERYIEEAINSVINQTYVHWELIVIDDGSTDQTAPIVKSIRDNRIRYSYQENRGQASALNHGLDLANGEYVATLDADDTYRPNSLSVHVAFLEQNPEFGAVYSDGWFCDPQGMPIKKISETRPDNFDGNIYKNLVVSQILGAPGVVMVRSRILKEHNIRYDENITWCQDWDIYIRIAEKCSFGYVDQVTFNYRIHGSNMTITLPKRTQIDSLTCLKFKVLNSPSFALIPNANKSIFFYNFLINTLNDQITKQSVVMASKSFTSLPKIERAQLFRLLAANYILQGNNLEIARSYLYKSWILHPLDLRTNSLLLLLFLNPNLAAKLIRKRRMFAGVNSEHHVFEMVPKGN